MIVAPPSRPEAEARTRKPNSMVILGVACLLSTVIAALVILRYTADPETIGRKEDEATRHGKVVNLGSFVPGGSGPSGSNTFPSPGLDRKTLASLEWFLACLLILLSMALITMGLLKLHQYCRPCASDIEAQHGVQDEQKKMLKVEAPEGKPIQTVLVCKPETKAPLPTGSHV